ncbi:uncharacterized protein IL334_006871 [Kwoniella shivajii]|uniref:Major facilitator superfamily (MFS) profile domain-containing protein n=1 Tax=Kwoniella shivajii TaxID=564305 RepID=A0ABZ1D762_9TREE|nr:hypothetical protein IL334_006871 [Kwoniella shivajii]
MGFWTPMRKRQKSALELAEANYVKSDAEKRMVWKLDMFLMTFGFISQVIKFLDQTSISTAYVSGMKEELNLLGNELNFFTTYFNIGYAIFLIPSQYFITWFRPSLYLPCLELAWGIVTCLMATVKNAKGIYALRAFLGAFESSAYPGMTILLTTWYTPMELARRMAIYQAAQPCGSMLSSAFQNAVYGTLNGKAGLSGWKWLFVVDGLITIVWAVAGIFFIPDYPNRRNPRAFWYNDQDAALALERNRRWRKAPSRPAGYAALKRVFLSPVVYVFAAIYISMNMSTAGASYFNLWVKSLKVYSVEKINAITLSAYAVNVVTLITWGFLIDWFPSLPFLLILEVSLQLIPNIIMSIWNVPQGAKWFSFYFLYVPSSYSPVSFAWMAQMWTHDAEARSILYGATIALNYAIQSWSGVLIWPAKEAPHYSHAWQTSCALIPFCILMIFLLIWVDKKYVKPKRDAYALAVEHEPEEVQAEEVGSATYNDEKDLKATPGPVHPTTMPKVTYLEA